MKRIIITVSNDLNTDQRIQRVAQTLAQNGYQISLIGRILKNSQMVDLPYSCHRFRLWFNKGPFFYANLNIRLFWFLLWHKFDAVLSNDLDTLTACRLASLLKFKKIVYDSHEYFTEVPELVGRHFQKAVWKCIEKTFLPGVKHAYTVCRSLADIYQKQYHVPFAVIRNLPFRNRLIIEPPKRKSNIIIYQGALNLGRGIEMMIESMQYLTDYEMWIVGTGDIERALKEHANNQTMGGKVIFLGRLSPEKLRDITIQAKLGLSLEDDMGLNYYYALPNKLFDYIQARIPVLVADLPEMRGMVEQYGVGEWLTERTPEALARQIKNLLENSTKIEQIDRNLAIAAEELCWDNEEQKLIAIFNKVFE